MPAPTGPARHPGQRCRHPAPPGQTAAVPLATLVRGVAPGDNVLFTGLAAPPAQMLAHVIGYTEEVVAVRAGPPANPPALMPHTTLEVRAIDVDRLATAIANTDEVGSIAMRYGLREVGTLIPTPAAALARLGLTVTVPAGLMLPADGTVALQDDTGTGLLVTASDPSAGTVQLSALDGNPSRWTRRCRHRSRCLPTLCRSAGGRRCMPRS